jgi:hypothetical protein
VPAAVAARYDFIGAYTPHLNKNSELAARHRGLGAIAFRNVARSRVLVAKGDEPGQVLMIAEKANLVRDQDKKQAAVLQLAVAIQK